MFPALVPNRGNHSLAAKALSRYGRRPPLGEGPMRKAGVSTILARAAMSLQTMRERAKAYLAGPDVFLPDAKEIGRRKVALCAEFGIDGLYPLDKEVDGAPGRQLAMRISAANEQLIDRCDIVIANLTPFRSPSLDPGTAFEIGFARAQKKRIYGYSASTIPMTDRVRRAFALADDAVKDSHGNEIEQFGLVDNLMIDGAITAGGGTIVCIDERSLAAMEAFRELLRRIG
jgi:nucleoside 2-deoxyribosyltransferase